MRIPKGPVGKADLLSGLAFLGIAILIYVGASAIPPPRYEPLGAAFFPKWLSIILGVLALGVIGRGLLAGEMKTEAGETPGFSLISLAPVAMILGLSVLYFWSIDALSIDFRVSTALYLISSGAILAGWRPKLLVQIVCFAIPFAILVRWVFTEIIFVPLP